VPPPNTPWAGSVRQRLHDLSGAGAQCWIEDQVPVDGKEQDNQLLCTPESLAGQPERFAAGVHRGMGVVIPVDPLGASGLWDETTDARDRRWALGGILVALAAVAGAAWLGLD
jgi:hypothetical protein